MSRDEQGPGNEPGREAASAKAAKVGRAKWTERLGRGRWILLGLVIVALALLPRYFLGPLGSPGSLVPHRAGAFYGQYFPSPKPAGDFELTNYNGNPVRLSDFRGKVLLLSFGFTNCPDICPTTLNSWNQVYEQLSPGQQERVRMLFVSVDPKRDTPERLKQYIPFFNPAFMGATGSEERIRKMAGEYGAFYQYVSQPRAQAKDYYTVTHSAYTYLIDPTGGLRLLYGFEKLGEPEKIAADIRRILEGATKERKEHKT